MNKKEVTALLFNVDILEPWALQRFVGGDSFLGVQLQHLVHQVERGRGQVPELLFESPLVGLLGPQRAPEGQPHHVRPHGGARRAAQPRDHVQLRHLNVGTLPAHAARRNLPLVGIAMHSGNFTYFADNILHTLNVSVISNTSLD